MNSFAWPFTFYSWVQIVASKKSQSQILTFFKFFLQKRLSCLRTLRTYVGMWTSLIRYLPVCCGILELVRRAGDFVGIFQACISNSLLVLRSYSLALEVACICCSSFKLVLWYYCVLKKLYTLLWHHKISISSLSIDGKKCAVNWNLWWY